MATLNAQQVQRLTRLSKLLQGGNVAVLMHLLDLDDKYERSLSKEKSEIKSGPPGRTPRRGEDYMTADDVAYFKAHLASLVRNPDEREIVKGVLAKVKLPKDGKDGTRGPRGEKGDRGNPGERGQKGDSGRIEDIAPQTLRDLLELLQGDERIDAKSIKGLPEAVKGLNPPNGPMLHPVALGNLPDINVVGARPGQSLVYAGTYWKAAPGAFEPLTQAQISALTPYNGQTVFNTTTGGPQIYVNGVWGNILLN